MHPEFNRNKLKELEVSQQPGEDSKQTWWKMISKGAGAVANFFKGHVTSSDGSEMKSLPIVKTYLEPYSKFITGEISLNLNLLEATDEIVYIIESLIKSHFNIKSNHGCLLASHVKKVQKRSESISRMLYISCTYICLRQLLIINLSEFSYS